jgi:hypothetical protein
MRRSITATAMVIALALSVFASTASADGHRPPPFNQPHTHALLVGADVEWVTPQPGLPPYVIHGFDRCVPLAGGRTVPLDAHHDRVHFGRAGEALIEAGHLVVPLSIFGLDSCAELEALLPFP